MRLAPWHSPNMDNGSGHPSLDSAGCMDSSPWSRPCPSIACLLVDANQLARTLKTANDMAADSARYFCIPAVGRVSSLALFCPWYGLGRTTGNHLWSWALCLWADRSRIGYAAFNYALFSGGGAGKIYFGIEVSSILLTFVASLWLFRHDIAVALFSIIIVLLSVFSGSAQSMARYVLVVPALYIFLAYLGGTRHSIVRGQSSAYYF